MSKIPEQGEARDHAPEAGGDLGFELPQPAKLSRGRAVLLGIGTIAVLGIAFVAGWLPRHKARAALEVGTKGTSSVELRVTVMAPKVASSDRSLLLPASVQPLEETVIYPRASGYVKKWYFDIGEAVKEGDLLAEIETPEVEQQVAQARAQLARAEAGVAQTKATRDQAKKTLERYEQLSAQGLASKQDLEEKRSQADVEDANVRVAEATVIGQHASIKQLAQLQSFSRVTAPFGGKVTVRNVERGALVTAGNSTPLFKVSATDPMRVMIQVPQDVAPTVRVDQPAKITVREYADRAFEGKIAHVAGALDPASRTMLTEVRVPNGDGALFGGMYAQVALNLATPHRIFELPASALLNDARGLRVAIVGADSRVQLVPVILERDTGATVEISSGLDGSERVVKLASADLDGLHVEIAP